MPLRLGSFLHEGSGQKLSSPRRTESSKTSAEGAYKGAGDVLSLGEGEVEN